MVGKIQLQSQNNCPHARHGALLINLARPARSATAGPYQCPRSVCMRLPNTSPYPLCRSQHALIITRLSCRKNCLRCPVLRHFIIISFRSSITKPHLPSKKKPIPTSTLNSLQALLRHPTLNSLFQSPLRSTDGKSRPPVKKYRSPQGQRKQNN